MHPLQKDCDPENPQQHAAWCWAAGIPDPAPSRPMPIPLIPPQLAGGLSQLLWDFGFRHHPELQTKWIEGTAGLGMLAKLVSTRSEESSDFADLARKFLAENRPEILEQIDAATTPEEKRKLLERFESNADGLSGFITAIKGDV